MLRITVISHSGAVLRLLDLRAEQIPRRFVDAVDTSISTIDC